MEKAYTRERQPLEAEVGAELQPADTLDTQVEADEVFDEETSLYSAPIRIAFSSMAACPSSNSNNNDLDNTTRLQQSYGNLATLRLLSQNLAIQPKLKISQPKDHYEQEADYIADLITGNAGMDIRKRPG